MLKIFNTLTKKKEYFIPIYSNYVNIYLCGITSYQNSHIGHARIFIFFDLIIRYLSFLGYKVKYIRNITDIDDKIINFLISQKLKYKLINFKEYIKKNINDIKSDFIKLNLLKVNFEPQVTNYISNIKNFIFKLLKLKYAYIYKGDVLFNINKFKNYGKLSFNINKNNIINNYKYSLLINKNNIYKNINFVLWKKKKNNNITNNLNINWDSPWGEGRPGWHIECSSISHYYLGDYFDIHGGGKDLIFPHHENEIAQCESLYDHPHVKYWIHTGLVTINNQKMSKSLNNFLTIKQILKFYSDEEIKLTFLTTHYRKNFNFEYKKFYKSKIALNRMYLAIKNIKLVNLNYKNKEIIYYEKSFFNALNDDFNTPKACSILFKITNKINNLKLNLNIKINKLLINIYTNKLIELANIIGLLTNINNNNIIIKNLNSNINKLILLRNNARKLQKWKLSDYIRNKLYHLGIKTNDKTIFNNDNIYF